MKIIFYTNIVSPHQLPWCRFFATFVGEDNFLYLAAENLHNERQVLGWGESKENWIHYVDDASDVYARELENCDVLITTLRVFDLIQKRSGSGLLTYYMFERWFKPPCGALRLFHPGYFRMCLAFQSLLLDNHVRLLPIGVFAVSDIVRLQNTLVNPLASLCKKYYFDPTTTYPTQQLGLNSMRLWGYFVEAGTNDLMPLKRDELSLFWCGRMLDWKRVDVLMKAVVSLLDRNIPVTLTLVGHGPEEKYLSKLARNWLDKKIFFHPPVKIEHVRMLMRERDVYVLSSDGGEGWGAALNEAMNEGMIPVGTYEAGSSATMIRHGINGFLYHSMNAEELADILSHIWALKQSGKDQEIRKNSLQTIRDIWSPENAAVKLLEDCKTWIKE